MAELDSIARELLAELERLPASRLMLAGEALRLGGGDLAGFGTAFCYFADSSRELARVKTAFELRRVTARSPDAVLRLADASTQPWIALREALVEAAHAQVPAHTSE